MCCYIVDVKMSGCKCYNPDKVFQNFKVVEFPISFVGLSTSLTLDVGTDISTSAYLKTFFEGRLLKLEKAREISENHRAFNVIQIDKRNIQVTYQPRNECISRAKRKKRLQNRFTFDLRIIQVDGERCCSNELHAEIGRFYICGQYDYCQITHEPGIVDFGDAFLNEKVTAYVLIRNESNLVAANVQYERINSFDVVPKNVTLPPNSSKRLVISIVPAALKVPTTLKFEIRNPHYMYDDKFEKICTKDDNYIIYIINAKINILYNKKPKISKIESLHKLYDRLPKYTYLNKELEIYNERKATALKYSKICRCTHKCTCLTRTVKSKFTTGNVTCYSDPAFMVKETGKKNFCEVVVPKASIFDLFDILLQPFLIDFGLVGALTYGKEELTITNETKYNVSIQLCRDKCVVYTENHFRSLLIKLKPSEKSTILIYCVGLEEGIYKGSFEYLIDNTYKLNHLYTLQVSDPILQIRERSLKFGMVSSDSFITSVPIRICNHFNETIHFNWSDIYLDIPFEVMPMSGSVQGHSCEICDITYICNPTKTKTHELNLISECFNKSIIPVEVSILTRKLSIKFLQPAVIFKDIPINLETIEKVMFENSSRELAIFQVIEPLIPGVRMEPMSGIIRPKMIITFDIIVKIACILEFAFDIFVKINNKELVSLSISGVVAEPKIIMAKSIYVPRVPSNLITYVPVSLQNISTLKAVVEVLDTGDEDIFNVYVANGNEKQRVFEFIIESGQSKTVFIKVHDIFRREYEMYIPFKVNGLLGPPIEGEPSSTELQYYISEYEQCYVSNPKVKLKSNNKDISYCRITGVITVPWIIFSVENFEFNFSPLTSNNIEFTMKNISKYYLYVTILTSKLWPYFSLKLCSEHSEMITNESQIKLQLNQEEEARLLVAFHPKGYGRFVATATFFLDKHMTIPYSNLTFHGKRETPVMTPSTYRVIFPPCHVGTKITEIITIDMEADTDLNFLSCISNDEIHILVEFVDYEQKTENNEVHTIVTVELKMSSETPYTGKISLSFEHENESRCEVDVYFCFTYCPLTLHANCVVEPKSNPYPYYPSSTQTDLYFYLEKCCEFLEKWMFQQGFRRDLYPVIPDTFHATSIVISSNSVMRTGKGMNVSYLNFLKRIAGPLMKHVRKVSVYGVDDSFKYVKEIHDTYKRIIALLQSRNANLSALQAKHLLSYEQFIIYEDYVPSTCNADISLAKQLLTNADLFHRLNKQSWIDFILQSYKVFIMDSCFFECTCISNEPRDIVQILINWYNEQIETQHDILRGRMKPMKVITNITTDLTDGIALASAIMRYCPFLRQHFDIFCEVNDETREGDIINNACLITEAMNQLRLYFPLCSKDFFEPNFIQMLFLSIHLYVVLPTFKPRDTIVLNPPLLRTSTRHISISPSSQETLIFSFIILNNNRNTFVAEKVTSAENGKKMSISVKYVANFVDDEECLLLVHGYNKTRIFDTYIVFILHGQISALNPDKKCKVIGPLYRPNKVDLLVSSPFPHAATYNVHITDVEPTTPVRFCDVNVPQFYVRRLNLIDKEIFLNAAPKDAAQEITGHKLYLQVICLSTQVGNTWIWFRSEIGQFFIKVTTQPRSDITIDSLQAPLQLWPMDPCSCGEDCECYRTTFVMVPHRNELMLKALRYALMENASPAMMKIFDQLIETETGKTILALLLEEGGTNMSEMVHLLRSHTTYEITSRALQPRLDNVTLAQHTDAFVQVPITVPLCKTIDKYSLTLTSDCGMDMRTYRVYFLESDGLNSSSLST